MHIRWTETASRDLEAIANYLFEHSPDAAPVLVERILAAADSLNQFPYRGRSGRQPGTRELVIANLPYLVVYTIASEAVIVARILHGAQQWPQ